MRHRVLFLMQRVLLCAVICGAILGEPEARAEGEFGYVFQGGVPVKQFKKQAYPVVGSLNNRLLLRTSNGERKVRFGQGQVAVQSKMVATRHFARVDNFDISFENRAQMRRDQALDTALAADVEYAQSQLDQINSGIVERASGQPENMSKEEYSDAMSEAKDASANLQALVRESVSSLADTIFIGFDVLSESDFENAYAALVVYHDVVNGESGGTRRLAIPSFERIGALQAGVPQSLTFDLSAREQRFENLELELFLFAEDGEPIATNVSKQLNRLPLEEYEQLLSELERRSISRLRRLK